MKVAPHGRVRGTSPERAAELHLSRYLSSRFAALESCACQSLGWAGRVKVGAIDVLPMRAAPISIPKNRAASPVRVHCLPMLPEGGGDPHDCGRIGASGAGLYLSQMQMIGYYKLILYYKHAIASQIPTNDI